MLSSKEEEIRQALIKKLINELGFEKNLISVEKELSSLPGLTRSPPNRRIDILCYAKDIHQENHLQPLLMIECKAIKLTNRALEQVAGYNHYVGACFMGIANQEEFILFWKNPKGKLERINFLPNYFQLISSINTNKQ